MNVNGTNIQQLPQFTPSNVHESFYELIPHPQNHVEPLITPVKQLQEAMDQLSSDELLQLIGEYVSLTNEQIEQIEQKCKTLLVESNIEICKAKLKEIILLIYLPKELRAFAQEVANNKDKSNKNKQRLIGEVTPLNLENFGFTANLKELANNSLIYDWHHEQLENYKEMMKAFLLQYYNSKELNYLASEGVDFRKDKRLELITKLFKQGKLCTKSNNKNFSDMPNTEQNKIHNYIEVLESQGKIKKDEIEIISIQMRGWSKCNDKFCRKGCKKDIPGHSPSQVIYYKDNAGNYNNLAILEAFYVEDSKFQFLQSKL